MIVRTSLTESNNFKRTENPRNAIFKTRKEEFEEFIKNDPPHFIIDVLEAGFPLKYLIGTPYENLIDLDGIILWGIKSGIDLSEENRKFISDFLANTILNANETIPLVKFSEPFNILKKKFPEVIEAMKKFPLPIVTNHYSFCEDPWCEEMKVLYDFVYSYFNPFDYDPLFLVNFIRRGLYHPETNLETILEKYFKDFHGYFSYFVNNLSCKDLDETLFYNIKILNAMIRRRCKMSKSSKSGFLYRSLKGKRIGYLGKTKKEKFLKVLDKAIQYVGPDNLSPTYIRRLSNTIGAYSNCDSLKKYASFLSRHLEIGNCY